MSHQTFELLILGSSAATPTANRNPTAQLLNIAERFFLIDCGEGTQIQLRKYKTRFQSVNHIFISHLHGDHILGLPGLLASMNLLGRKNDLTIYAPKELEEMILIIHRFSDAHLNYQLHFIHTQDKIKQRARQDERTNRLIGIPNTRTKLETDRQTDRQTDKQIDRQTDRQIGR